MAESDKNVPPRQMDEESESRDPNSVQDETLKQQYENDNSDEEYAYVVSTAIENVPQICIQNSNEGGLVETVRFYDEEQNQADNYLESMFVNYAENSSENQQYIDMIRRYFCEHSCKRHIHAIFKDSLSLLQAQERIHNVVEDIKRDLLGENIHVNYSLTELQLESIQEIVANRITTQVVSIYVENVIRNAVKYLQQNWVQLSVRVVNMESGQWRETSLSFLRDREGKHDLDHSVDRTDNLEISENVRILTIDVNEECVANRLRKDSLSKYPKILKTRSSNDGSNDDWKGDTRAYCSHIKPSKYLAIPPAYRLPLYTKPPLPKCLSIPVTSLSRRSARVGYTFVMAPTFYLNEALTQVHSKLTKHYNSLS